MGTVPYDSAWRFRTAGYTQRIRYELLFGLFRDMQGGR